MLYALFALLAALAAAVLALPVLQRRGASVGRAGHDVAIYRAQLAELSAERDAGAIGPAEAEAARIEVERRLLRAADQAEPDSRPDLSPGSRKLAALGVAGGVVALAALIYGAQGHPDLPDRPAVREADVPAGEATADELAVRMAAAMRERPDELRGWLMQGQLASSVGRFDLATEAYEGAVRLEPGVVGHWLSLGLARVARDAGMVNAGARDAFGKALVLDPANPVARYYLGLASFQDHDDRAAFDRWAALAAETPPDAEYAGLLARGLNRAARRMGISAPDTDAAPSAPGPSAAQVEAARDMSEGDRGAMIEGMVQRLADRLKQNPDDLDGWLRLGKAYAVLGRTDDAISAYGQAQRIDPANAAAREALAALKGG
ncbi:c-type cytochrome biogenesis protein CcmI [Emcibacter sp. SYSU 3D8]|uniref:c-type cytochrome biogenesis protein CcmI n=1 Tax=Emcibacter sp. SYSU 3D8 TaxID=3133969 RepID=UPI0031FE711D